MVLGAIYCSPLSCCQTNPSFVCAALVHVDTGGLKAAMVGPRFSELTFRFPLAVRQSEDQSITLSGCSHCAASHYCSESCVSCVLSLDCFWNRDSCDDAHVTVWTVVSLRCKVGKTTQRLFATSSQLWVDFCLSSQALSALKCHVGV